MRFIGGVEFRGWHLPKDKPSSKLAISVWGCFHHCLVTWIPRRGNPNQRLLPCVNPFGPFS